VKARVLGVRPSISVVIAAEVVVIAALTVLPPRHFGWWPAAVIGVVAAIALVLTVYRRNAVAWLAAAARWHSVRRGGAVAAAAIDVPHGSGLCGVRVDEHEAITVISVSGKPYVPTLLRGATTSETPNVVPLGTLAGLLDQPGGLRLASIDVVSAGLRVRRGTGYPPLYSTLLADRPAAGQRSTRLIVRLDIPSSAPGLTYRNSIGSAAAAVAERIVNALLQEGIRAEALSAHQIDTALAELGAGLVTAPVRPDEDGGETPGRIGRSGVASEVGWRTVNAHPGHLTTYYFSPEDITTAALNQMWALRTDEVVEMISVSRQPGADADGRGPVLVSATVRCNDPQRPPQPPTLFLNPLPGDQHAATVRAAPTAAPALALPTRPLGDPATLAIPIGPTGILVGTAVADDPQQGMRADDLVMLSLTDPQRATRIVMNTSQFYARQLLVRAAAVGERIAIYTNNPAQWGPLEGPYIAVVGPSRPPEFVPSIIVSDRPGTPPAAGLAATVITIGRGETGGHAPDLQFVQLSESIVRITAPTFVTEVAIAAFRQEQAWTG
jgi:type VII secretion protein EccE